MRAQVSITCLSLNKCLVMMKDEEQMLMHHELDLGLSRFPAHMHK